MLVVTSNEPVLNAVGMSIMGHDTTLAYSGDNHSLTFNASYTIGPDDFCLTSDYCNVRSPQPCILFALKIIGTGVVFWVTAP